MTDPASRTPAEWADEAAEAVRWLSHATITGGGYVYPSDVDETLANLQNMVERLPQVLRQMSRWIGRQADLGLVRHDGHLDHAEATEHGFTATAELIGDLDAATAMLGLLAMELGRARSQSTHLGAPTVEPLDTDSP